MSILRHAPPIFVAIALLAAPVPGFAAGDAVSCPAGDSDATAVTAVREAAASTLFTRPEATVPANKRTNRGLYLTAVDARDMVSEDPAGVLFIDVRTRGELQFIGMPTLVDAQVPYLVEAVPLQWDETASSFKLVPNPDFVAAVDRRLQAKRLTRDAPVIVICQGGGRAARAVNALTAAGYTTAYTVIDGFEGDPVAEGPSKGLRRVDGWRNAGLPWTTKLDRAKVYGFD
jgi:rhodanese-related sulfurtransferase